MFCVSMAIKSVIKDQCMFYWLTEMVTLRKLSLKEQKIEENNSERHLYGIFKMESFLKMDKRL